MKQAFRPCAITVRWRYGLHPGPRSLEPVLESSLRSGLLQTGISHEKSPRPRRHHPFPGHHAKQVEAAANAIAGIANSGMGALYGPGTDKDIGSVKTRVKPELFTDKEGVGKVAVAFIAAANDLEKAAATGDKAAVQKAFGDTGAACKGCHEKFRQE